MVFKKRIPLERLLLVALLFVASLTNAQTSGSPYSAFGIGDIEPQSFGRTMAMGGAGIGLRMPNTVFVGNPASYSTIATQSFLFDAGIRYEQTNYETSELAQIGNSASLSHLSFAFPVINGKWYTAAGLLPYSSTGYNIATYDYATGIGDQSNTYSGVGGINRVFWGNSVKFLKHFSVGVNASFLFGSVEKNWESIVSDEKSSSQISSTDKTVVRDFMFDYGIQYSQAYTDNIHLTLGATLSQPMAIDTRRSILTTGIHFVDNRQALDPSTGGIKIDTLQVSTDVDGKINMPLQLGFGASVSLWKKFILAADYKVGKWSDESQEGISGSLSDSEQWNFGFQYVPNYRSMKYIDRISLRAGAQLSKTYWDINGEQLTDRSVMIGLGLPMRRSASTFDFMLEVGQRGTLDNNLMQETYLKAAVSFTLQDFWFIKRKFK